MSSPGITPQPPEAEGARAYRQLRAGGFTQDEADRWRAEQTAHLNAGGFTPKEIDAYWGNTAPSPDHTDRLANTGINSLSPEQRQAAADDPMEMFSAGWQSSVLGLLTRGKAPDKVAPENAGLFGRIMQALGQTVGDLPAMIAGQQVGSKAGALAGAAVPGAGETGVPEAVGGVLGGGFGAGAAPQAIRETLLAYYNRGDMHTFQDFWSVFSGSIVNTLKAGTIGAVMSKAGLLAGSAVARAGANATIQTGANLATQAITGTGVGGALDGHMPDGADFVTGAVLMLGMHAGSVVAGKFMPSSAANRVQTNLQRIYAERGIPPWEATQRAQNDPVWRQEVMGEDTAGVPVTPHIKAESPSEPPPFHEPVEPKPKPGEPEPEPTPFRTNPMRLQEEHDLDVARAVRGAHIATDVDAMLPLIRRLEGSGDAAISPAGAIGRYQIMPGTARQYGFDPAKLTDPAYNEKVARIILTDLHHRYNGVVDDILVAYNAGPGRANQWVMHGRPMRELPGETQKYLEHSDRLNGWGGEEPPGGNGGGRGGPPAERGGPAGEGEPEVPPDRLSKDSLEDIMHDIVGEPRPPEKVFSVDTMYRQWVSELGPARTLDKLFAAEGIIPKTPAMNTEDMFRQTYGSSQRAGYFVKFGTLDPLTLDKTGNLSVGHKSDESFMAAYDLAREAGGDARGFDAYRIAKRTVEKAGQGIRTAVDVTRAAALINKTEKTYGPASKMINRVKNASLDYARDSGLFSASQADIIKKYNEHHVTYRVLGGEPEVPLQGRGRGFRTGNPTKRMEGGEYKIMDPLTADIDNLNRIVSMADRNRAIGHVIGAIEAHAGLADALGLKKLPAPEVKAMLAEPGSNVFKPYNIAEGDQKAFEAFVAQRALDGAKSANRFIYFRDGKAEVWEAKDPAIANLMRGADAKPQMDFITKIATAFASLARSGITLSPDYAPRLALRDQVTTAILDKQGGIPFSNLLRGIIPTLKLDENFRRWNANGGAGTALVEIDTNYIKRDIDSILHKTGTFGKLWNTVQHPIQFARLVSERIDAMPRVGYMMNNEAELGTLKAATGGRKAYLDFPERGTSAIANWMARITPFFSANVLGAKQLYEAFRENPAATMTKTAAYITLPSIGLYILNYMQDQTKAENDPTRYDQIPRWQRDTMFIAPEIGGVRFRLGMPPIIGPLFGGMINRLMDDMVRQDKHAFEDWATSIWAQFLPPMIPTVALPVIEAASNHNFYSGKALIPSSLEDASGPMQYTENTTAPAKALARVIGPQHADLANVSPIVIENFVREWAGTTGMNALKALNAPFDERGKPSEITDLPFVQSFLITNPGANSYTIQGFYDKLADFREAHADMMLATDRAMTSGDTTELEQAATNPQAFISLANVSRALKVQRQTILAINHNETMTDDEKRQATTNVVASMIDTARFGLTLMDSVDEAR